MLHIIGRSNSGNVQKVLWACEELSLPFTREDRGGTFGGNDDPHYLKMNPNGLVPTIIDGDAVIWESNTILRYLACKYGADTMWEPDPAQRTLGERWMDWQLAVLAPAHRVLFYQLIRTPEDKRDQTAIAKSRDMMATAMQLFDQGIPDSTYLGGERFTVADIALGIFVHRWFALPIFREPYPRAQRWYRAIAERQGFRKYVDVGLS
ncbi:MAG: glutathione S-transferase family protein [Steroidobacteraceae bacterium]